RRPPVLVATGLALVLAGAVSTASLAWWSPDASGHPTHSGVPSSAPRTSVLVLGARSGYVDWNSRLVVDVLNGSPRSVSVTSDGYWGDSARSAELRIGHSHVSLVDVGRHIMTVRDDGRVVRTIPVSAGRDKYPTKSGVHIALSKAQMVIMDSATVGIPRNSPDGYYEKVYWDVRISDGGAFVHAAPWSVGAQGHRNVSHGCVNISTSEAIWFYNFSQRGDIVNIVNSGAAPD